MPRLMLGLVCGLVYGALSAASMIPLEFPDKRAALLGGFINRFSIGFVIGAVRLDWPNWLVGLVFGVLLSLADAIITKAYAPIIVFGDRRNDYWFNRGQVGQLITHEVGKKNFQHQWRL